MEVSIDLIPAKELPKTEPVIIGLFVEPKDNTILVQSTSLKTGGKGIVVHKGEDGSVSPSSNMIYGPKIEVLITNDTTIYRDTTQPGEPSTNETQTVQQTVEESHWTISTHNPKLRCGVAKVEIELLPRVLLYSNPVLFERPGRSPRQESIRNKKQILVIGFRVLVVGAAAFIGARMLNGEVNPFGLNRKRLATDSHAFSVIMYETCPQDKSVISTLTWRHLARKSKTSEVFRMDSRLGDSSIDFRSLRW